MSKKSKKDRKKKSEKLREQNIKETIRMLEWAGKTCGLWSVLCGSEEGKISMQEFNALRNSIIENHFYYLLPVLMSVHQNTEFVNRATRLTLLDSLVRDLKSGNSDSVIKCCIEHTK